MRRAYIYTLFAVIAISITCGSAGARQEISLNGSWEMQYSHNGDHPPAEGWTAVTVPSHVSRQEERYVWYKESFNISASMSGQRIFLKFGGVKFVSEVYVNGKSVGGYYGGWEPFEVEITDDCEIGQKNQLLVSVTDVRGVIDQELDYSQRSEGERFIEMARDSVMAPVGSQPDRFGIWQDVSLEARSDVYIDDVFVKTSVRDKTIEVDFTLANLSDRERSVIVEGQAYDAEGVQLEIGEGTVIVPSHSTATLTLRSPWPSPRLWSPEDPHLYSLMSRLMEEESDGQQRHLDERSIRFGFREFWIDGIYFFLNGTKIKFLATAGHPNYGSTKEDAKKLYADIRSANCVAMRLHANVWPESWYEAADEVGMLLIQESALWCFAQEYALSNVKFWGNMKDHLSGMIRRDKNHPSVVMYSIENEILHVGGDRVPETEARLAELGEFVKSIDPTRPIMYDGDADPMGVADVENLHYPHEFPEWNLWPDTAYWVDDKTYVSGWPRREWQWERKEPLYMGEFLWTTYQTPDAYTIFIGDDAYLDYNTARARSKAAAWSMQVEAFRAAEVSGMCPWTLLEAGKFPNIQYDAVKRAYEPNAAFVKEYDSRFYSSETVTRTIYLYNDTPHPADLTLNWELKAGNGESGGNSETGSIQSDPASPRASIPWDIDRNGMVDFLDFIIVASHFGGQITSFVYPSPDVNGDGLVNFLDLLVVGTHLGGKYDENLMDSGKQGFKLAPAERISTNVTLHIPHVSERTQLAFHLRVESDGKTVFRDEKRYWAFPMQELDVPDEAQIAVYTGDTEQIGLLDNVEYMNLTDLSEIPSDAHWEGEAPAEPLALLIIGPYALDSMADENSIPTVGDESAPGDRLAEFVNNGGTALVMQQSVYPEGLLPASLTNHSSTVAFKRVPNSDIFKGVSDEDLKMWRGDHLVSENDVLKPTGGCFRATIDSGGTDGLTYLPLVEIFSGRGRYLLCQLSLVREHEEPIAQILFENMINYALNPPEERAKMAIIQDKLDIKQDIGSVGAVCDDLSGNLSQQSLTDYGVIIAEAGASEMANNVNKIADFVQSGGKVLLHGLVPDNLGQLNGLFPEEIILNRSTSVPVTIFQRDPVISGLTNQDLYWLGEHVGSWHDRTPLSLEVMDYVVSRELPELGQCQVIEAEDMAVEYGSPNFRGNAVYMYASAAVSAEIDFQESAEYAFGVRASGTPFDGVYAETTFLVDGIRRGSVMLDGPDWAIYTVTIQIDAGQHSVALAFTNDKWDPVTKEDRNLTLDKLYYAQAEATGGEALLTPAALVKIPMGEGFYLIDQINWHGRAASQDKAAKYLTNLLVNLGAPFVDQTGGLSISGAKMKPVEGLRNYSTSDAVARLGSNGYIYSDIEFASSRGYTFEISARGTAAAGEYPNIRLSIDEDIIGAQTLQYAGWGTLVFKAFVDAGVHRVSLAFTNDYWEPPEDRNLEIRGLKIK